MKNNDFPAIYQSADDLSLRSQKLFYFVLSLHLFCLIAASVISVIGSKYFLFPLLQAVLFLGALICALYLYLGKPDRYWYNGRAIAESIKTSTWKFVCKSEPFDTSDIEANSQLKGLIKSIVEQNRDITQHQLSNLTDPQITDEMRRIRRLNAIDRKEIYIQHRINEQQEWYAKKAKLNKSTLNRFYIGLISVNALAITFAIARVEFININYWPTDALVAISASFLTWIQAKRYQELSASYALAAHEISLIKEQASHDMNDDELSKFVADAENAFSREHTQWVARKDS